MSGEGCVVCVEEIRMIVCECHGHVAVKMTMIEWAGSWSRSREYKVEVGNRYRILFPSQTSQSGRVRCSGWILWPRRQYVGLSIVTFLDTTVVDGDGNDDLM